MKVRKGKIELAINPNDWEKFKQAGWSKKREVDPTYRKQKYLEEKARRRELKNDND